MKLKHIIVLFSFLQCGFLFSTENQYKGDITGTVLDSRSKAPVEYATVALFKKADSSLVAGCVTDIKGFFTIEKICCSVFGNIYNVRARVKDINRTYNYSEISYSSRFSLQYKPLKNTSIELSGTYQGAQREAHGKRQPIYMANLGFRQNLLNNKLNISISANDIFHTYCYQYTEINNNFKSTLIFKGEYPQIFVGLSYKINDYKANQQPANNSSHVPAI